MVAVPPGATPVMVDVVPPLVAMATAVFRLVHSPPVVASDKLMVLPPQNDVPGPVISIGVLLVIVSVSATEQPFIVYDIVVVPALAAPVTIPLEEPIVALLVLLLVQLPPPGVAVNVVVV